MNRDEYLTLSDEELSRRCRWEFFKGSGNGGQKRNKCATAVRATLEEFNLSVSDCSERSQYRNRANALRKLRISLALAVRIKPATPPLRSVCSQNSVDYPLYMAHVLDLLSENNLDYRIVAPQCGLTPTALLKKLAKDPVVWGWLVQVRKSNDHPQLPVVSSDKTDRDVE